MRNYDKDADRFQDEFVTLARQLCEDQNVEIDQIVIKPKSFKVVFYDADELAKRSYEMPVIPGIE